MRDIVLINQYIIYREAIKGKFVVHLAPKDSRIAIRELAESKKATGTIVVTVTTKEIEKYKGVYDSCLWTSESSLNQAFQVLDRWCHSNKLWGTVEYLLSLGANFEGDFKEYCLSQHFLSDPRVVELVEFFTVIGRFYGDENMLMQHISETLRLGVWIREEYRERLRSLL